MLALQIAFIILFCGGSMLTFAFSVKEKGDAVAFSGLATAIMTVAFFIFQFI